MRVRDPQFQGQCQFQVQVQVPMGRGCFGWLADGDGLLGGSTNGAWTCRPWLPRAPGRSGRGGWSSQLGEAEASEC